MGTLSRPASDLHTKYHRPPDRSSDLLGGARGVRRFGRYFFCALAASIAKPFTSRTD
jgi:hypothetical protein